LIITLGVVLGVILDGWLYLEHNNTAYQQVEFADIST
jgi:hypothetical protein